MATAKKAAVKKSAAKKAAVKKSAAKKMATSKGPSGPQVGEPAEGSIATPQLSVEQLGEEVASGKWGTGRERDDALRQAGHDPAEVQKAAAKHRASQKEAPTRLPIPNNRRGSSWT